MVSVTDENLRYTMQRVAVMYPIFYCRECKKTFQFTIEANHVILETLCDCDVQYALKGHLGSRQTIICQLCRSPEINLNDQGHCTLLKLPANPKTRELKTLRKEGMPVYVRNLAQKLAT